MSQNINLNLDWLRYDNTGATNSYYGYNNSSSNSESSNTWSIRQIAASAAVYWNNNINFAYEVSWSNRITYFQVPGNIATISATAAGGPGPSIVSTTSSTANSVYAITFNWSTATGSSRYYLTAYRDTALIMNFLDGGSTIYNPNQNTYIKQLINNNSITIANCPSGHTYSIYVYANNGFGTSSTVTSSISL